MTPDSQSRRVLDSAQPHILEIALALAALVAVALWLRVAHLDHNSFFVDEYFHVLAGDQLRVSGEPRLPGGGLYRRALPYTYLVSGSFALFGVSEWSARLPSALVGTLLVLVVFAVGRRWFGVGAGLVAAAIVACGPPVVDTARLCRMYSSFQVAYLGMVFAYERGWEPRDRAVRGGLFWRLAFPFLLYGSYRLHLLTADFGAAIAVYWLVMLGLTRDRRFAALLGAMVVATFAVAITGIVDVRAIGETALLVPGWALARQDDNAYYLSVWSEAYPWMWFVAPVAGVFACIRYRRTGFFLATQLAVPFVLHSFVFGWKELRYVSHLFPLLALLLAPALVAAGAAVVDGLRGWNDRWRTRSRWLRFAGLAVVVEVAAMVVILGALPSISIALGLQRGAYIPDWRDAFGYIAQSAQPGDVVLSAVPFAAVYYLPHEGVRLREEGDDRGGGERGSAAVAPWLAVDMNAGWQRSLADLQRKIESHRRGWLVIEPAWLDNAGIVEPEVRSYINSHLSRPDAAFDPPILVFYWNR